MKKDWMYVTLTSLCEILWLLGFSFASSWWHWILIVGLIMLDFHFLAKACENLPTGTVYAIFAGVGTFGTVLMDLLIFDKPFDLMTSAFMLILIAGIIGLKLSDGKGKEA